MDKRYQVSPDVLSKPLPMVSAMNRAMANGHFSRFGHSIRGYLVSYDGGFLWERVLSCCEGQ
jgi:hypothetical protein